MRAILTVAGLALAAASTPGTAQDGAQAGASPSTCFIEVRKLMAEPPVGIGELGSAIRALDLKLRPQVEEVTRLKEAVGELEARQQQAMQNEDDRTDLTQLDEHLRHARADFESKQAQLKADYAAQQKAIVGPVQAHVGERAQAYAAAQGCAELKMARGPDLAALASAGAKNVTGDFVSWYALNKS
jgi:Skp family chaperone for outer membrane proteins